MELTSDSLISMIDKFRSEAIGVKGLRLNVNVVFLLFRCCLFVIFCVYFLIKCNIFDVLLQYVCCY